MSPANQRLQILWWGRHGNYGPDYPRNRTIIACLQELGHQVREFQPRWSAFGAVEARLRGFKTFDLVWVPCFRHRDLTAASGWASQKQLPLVFDPLISAYDKRVNEKRKFGAGSLRARRLLARERRLFSLADRVIADTRGHRDYFIDKLCCRPEKITVIPVSAEESLFYPEAQNRRQIPELLFFGTFIELQGPTLIAEAAKLYQGPPTTLTFLGDGPERQRCREILDDLKDSRMQVCFENWIEFRELPDRIRAADLCLGIFGTGDKARRVIPNKVYQALACGKPVITMDSAAYPRPLRRDGKPAIWFCEAGSPAAIARAMAEASTALAGGSFDGQAPRRVYENYFSNQVVKSRLKEMLRRVHPVSA